MKTNNLNWHQPEAYITVRKNRLKLYNDRDYYLKNNTNFEIELFNPTNESVLAKIWLNEELISPTGIIIKKNSRVYLDRFIDTANKFLFNVFQVDDVAETEKARKRNGSVTIEFYSPISNYDFNHNGLSVTNTPHYNYETIHTLNVNSNIITQTNTYNANLQYTAQVDTGRINKGDKSDQVFEYSDEKFSQFSHLQYTYQILPESLKVIDPTELRVYCDNCGLRIKKSSWKYCPSCGNTL